MAETDNGVWKAGSSTWLNGYPDSDNSWEPLANIPHGLIKEFHCRNPTKPAPQNSRDFIHLAFKLLWILQIFAGVNLVNLNM